MHAQDRRMYVVLALALFVGSAGVTYWLVKDGQVPELSQSPQVEMRSNTSAQDPVEQLRTKESRGLATRLQAGASLIRLFDGEDGQVHLLPVTDVPESLIGKSEDEVKRLNPDWSVLALEPDRLTVRVELAEAALASKTRYLGVYNGNVAIFQGKPGVVSKVEKVTDIPVEWLPEYEQANLTKGYVFAEEELDMILESLAEAAESRRK